MPSSDSVELWNDEATTFDEAADHGLRDPEVRAAWRDLLLSVLPPQPARVADLGCGTGTLALLLAAEGYAVDGVDFSPEMIRRAVAKPAVGQVTFTQADADNPPLEPGAYDVVLCRHVLWVMPDPAATLHRWIGLLAPGGRLVLVEGSWTTGRRPHRGRDRPSGRVDRPGGGAPDAPGGGVLGSGDRRRAVSRDQSVLTRLAYQLVSPRPPWRLSEMCMWSRWRSVREHFRLVLQLELR